jgi:cytoskeletal protein CcmA (bactofilin family)
MMNGETIVIKGDISASEDLDIAGLVEGSIAVEGRVLTLAAGSRVVGTIAASSVIVSGTVEGRIDAGARLEVRNTAIIDGDLSTPALLVADGAKLKATIQMPARVEYTPQLVGRHPERLRA